MSHFSVIVLGDNVKEQLQPYHEYECTGIEDQYVVDVDRTDEAKADYEKYGSNFDSFEQYVEYEYGTAVVDGRVLIKTNPNAKWDWWVVGGRWSGWLGKDEGVRSDFDFEQLRNKAALEASADYQRLRPKEIEPPSIGWVEWRENSPDIETARRTWREHPFNAAVREVDVWAEYESLFVDEATYVNKARQSAVVPFAMVTEGQWSAKGDMGWFAHVSNERTDWPDFVNQFLDDMTADMKLTVVDCHI